LAGHNDTTEAGADRMRQLEVEYLMQLGVSVPQSELRARGSAPGPGGVLQP
jgi:hypothetical protein